MSAKQAVVLRAATPADDFEALRRQYGGRIELTGTADAFYERHLLFDNVTDPDSTGARERYEAVARSVRDVLSQRWVRTEQTYARENPKRVYYLSMEFLIGRSLTNNITNLLLGPVALREAKVEINLNRSFGVGGGELRPIIGRPSKLIGIPYDRRVVGHGGRTINTLRLWAAAAPESFDFQTFSHGDFVGALAKTLA